MSKRSLPIAEEVLDSLNNGLYLTDTDRRILYWNSSAERIRRAEGIKQSHRWSSEG